MSEWQKEFYMFDSEALEDMKTFSDNTNEEREWMAYVYLKDGKYYLGEPSFGSESRIEVNPASKAAQDAVKNGLTSLGAKGFEANVLPNKSKVISFFLISKSAFVLSIISSNIT